MGKNMTYARESIVGSWHKYDQLNVARVKDSAFFKIFENAPKDNSVDQKLLRAIVELSKTVIMEEVLPSFKRLRTFLENEYLKSVRSTPGLSSLPNGSQFYR